MFSFLGEIITRKCDKVLPDINKEFLQDVSIILFNPAHIFKYSYLMPHMFFVLLLNFYFITSK